MSIGETEVGYMGILCTVFAINYYFFCKSKIVLIKFIKIVLLRTLSQLFSWINCFISEDFIFWDNFGFIEKLSR